ncbi:MAG TPA: hydantoinase/oxoprolinase family protein, partial [Xanthobacteraceae bacterium]|nr:hydantoinase/oxoprolinase family protein [Xanthobacteraceae bacterium]
MAPADTTPAGIVLGVDTGGTFTDVTLIDAGSGRMWNAKTPSTPSDPSQAFGAGIAEVLKLSGLRGNDIARVLHGTTIATNLILEGKGARAALMTTTGFKYVLEIGRQDVPRRSSLFRWIKPKRPVRPEHIFEIGGRVDPLGAELDPLDEAAVRLAARQIRRIGIDAVAIVFLHSYANPAHERLAAEIVRAEHPAALVSISSEVLPVFREYERSMTTILNVSVMPVVSAYVERLDRRVAEQGIAAPLLLMKSSGGVTSSATARKFPVETALSGPAAGVVGATFVGAAAGVRDLIGIDIGGTSADVCLIRNGAHGLTTNGRVGTWPLGLPMVDIVTIGAGGGSLARVSATGALTVGPDSAGADPGPVCYARGGTEPTVTDAHLVLGHLPPYLLGGGFALDVEAARRAVEVCVARPLGMSVEEAARGILAIVDNHMVGAIRLVSVERGHDPRDFALLAFGGAGPMHACELALDLGIHRIVMPRNPGLLCAWGASSAPLGREYSLTVRATNPHYRELLARASKLIRRVHAELRAEGARAIRHELWLDMRYRGQSYELEIALTPRFVTDFHSTHRKTFGHSSASAAVEVVNIRIRAVAGESAAKPKRIAHHAGTPAPVSNGRVIVGGRERTVPIYDRDSLGAGARIRGPIVI